MSESSIVEQDCTPEDLLLAGADDIFMNGLSKGAYRKPDGSCCILGSLGRHEILVEGCLTDGPIDETITTAVCSVVHYLNRNGHYSTVSSFNYAPDRTTQEMIQIMHDIARGVEP